MEGHIKQEMREKTRAKVHKEEIAVCKDQFEKQVTQENRSKIQEEISAELREEYSKRFQAVSQLGYGVIV